MMSLPIDASVVHLQLLVALTAHLLWALNLHTEQKEEKWLRVTLAESLQFLCGSTIQYFYKKLSKNINYECE